MWFLKFIIYFYNKYAQSRGWGKGRVADYLAFEVIVSCSLRSRDEKGVLKRTWLMLSGWSPGNRRMPVTRSVERIGDKRGQ